MKYKVLPPQDYLLECFDYNPITGEVFWKQRPQNHFKNIRSCNIWNSRYPHTIAGGQNGAHHRTRINKTDFITSRIIWKLITGQEPTSLIDHADTNFLNNQWANLRKADQSQNRHNSHMQPRNKTGYKGVRKSGEKFTAYISIAKHRKYLGTFETAEKAHLAYCRQVDIIFKEFARYE